MSSCSVEERTANEQENNVDIKYSFETFAAFFFITRAITA
jgi:hypothetical protein